MSCAKKVEEIHGICDGYSHDGKGIIHDGNQPIFVDSLLKGEEADVTIEYVSAGILHGKIKKLYSFSKNRVLPKCPVGTSCGGCCFQNLSYPAQLEYKKEKVQTCFRKIAQMDVDVDDCVGMENPYHYRNKIQMPVGKDKKGRIITGFYKSKTHQIIPVKSCAIEHPSASHIIETIRELMKKYRIPPYDEDALQGIIRHIYIRTSYYEKQILLVLVTAVDAFPGRNDFIKEIRKLHPEITSIVQNINTRDTNVILGNKNRVLSGPGYIEDSLCGIRFRISPMSFYQVNPQQTEKLYSLAIQKAGLTGNEVVLDAYCGIGTIGLIASKHAKHVIGVEIVEDAIRDAKNNARRNSVENIEFYAEDASEFIEKLAKSNMKMDVVFMDPPRKGSTTIFMDALMKLSPKKIVYISCDPATLARDVKYLSKEYEIQSISPVDMFPMGFHIETIVCLKKKVVI